MKQHYLYSLHLQVCLIHKQLTLENNMDHFQLLENKPQKNFQMNITISLFSRAK